MRTSREFARRRTGIRRAGGSQPVRRRVCRFFAARGPAVASAPRACVALCRAGLRRRVRRRFCTPWPWQAERCAGSSPVRAKNLHTLPATAARRGVWRLHAEGGFTGWFAGRQRRARSEFAGRPTRDRSGRPRSGGRCRPRGRRP